MLALLVAGLVSAWALCVALDIWLRRREREQQGRWQRPRYPLQAPPGRELRVIRGSRR